MRYVDNPNRRVDTSRVHDPLHLGWCEDLCKKFRDELGAVHLGTLAAHAMLGHVAICREDGENLGVMVTKPHLACDPKIFPIIAAAVPADLQRLSIGLTMIDRIIEVHGLDLGRVLQAKCRADLPSNRFWAAAGFYPVAVQHTSSTRAKPMIIWRKSAVGCADPGDEIIEGSRLRGGGARYLTADDVHLANVYDRSIEGVGWALKLSNARPIVGGWDHVDWAADDCFKEPEIVRMPGRRPIIGNIIDAPADSPQIGRRLK